MDHIESIMQFFGFAHLPEEAKDAAVRASFFK